MNIAQAMCYPFRKGNFIRTVLVPSLLSLVGSVIWLVPPVAIFSSLVPNIVSAIYAVPEPSEEIIIAQVNSIMAGSLPTFWASLGCGVLLSLLFLLPVHGYYWNLIDHLQSLGPDAKPPEWKGRFKTYLSEGLHFFIASLILALPFVMASLPLGLLVPFVMAAFFVSAHERTCIGTLRSFVSGFKLTAKRIGPVLGAFYLGMILSYLYSLAMGWTVILTNVGAPLFIHLMCQGYGINSDRAKTDSETTLPLSAENTIALPESYGADAVTNEKSAKDAISSSVMLHPAPAKDNRQKMAHDDFYCHKGDNPWLRHQQNKTGAK